MIHSKNAKEFLPEQLLLTCMIGLIIITSFSCSVPPIPPQQPAPPGWAERADSNEGLNCDFYLHDSNRWIPNNDVYCGDFCIKMWYYDNGIKYTLEDANPEGYEDIDLNNIKILSPWDWNQEDHTLDSDNSNIFKNKGHGFELYATDTTNTDYLLATFELKWDFEWEGEDDAGYNVYWNNDYFDTNGKVKEGYVFKTDENKDLYFGYTIHNEERRYYYYRITAQGYHIRPIRPGDDFVLRFACAEVSDATITSQGWPDDTFAVYDKIMLDRLNLFIDERVNPITGMPVEYQGNDSIDEWLERLGENDWNGRKQENYEIYPWTKFRDNSVVWGAVAYSYGCGDSVDDFNADMWDQYDTLQYWYLYDEEGEQWDWDITFPHPVYEIDVENTRAPNNNWDVYMHGTTAGGITYEPLQKHDYTFF
ncbi:MAG: hypothetical protein P8078_10640, partial [bacterium]